MAELTLPILFRNGMVLQRQKPICVWGKAEGADDVSVALGTASVIAQVQEGNWQTYLPPMQAQTGLTMTISTGNQMISLCDVAVGEVWLAGGQSNMEFLLRDDAERDQACAFDDADVRCFEIPKVAYAGQEKDRDYSQAGIWRKAGPAESEYFTAVGFYFARMLREKLTVPVGIINCTWGGTSASAWVDESCLTGELAFYLDRAAESRKKIDPLTEKEEYKKIQQMIDSMPPMNAIVNEHPLVADEKMKAAMAHMDLYNLCAYSPFRPCGLYKTMLLPLVPFTLRGVIWYQGESDEYFGALFEPLTRALIRKWRSLWQEDLPFLMVQLASFEYMMEPLNFVPIRQMQQRIAEDTPHVRLVCAMDAGLRYDIHPKYKRPVGERLALQALHHVYGLPMLSDSPTFKAIEKKEDRLIISFRYGERLYIKGEEAQTIDLTVDGQSAVTFDVCVEDDFLIITSPALRKAHTAMVRFAWHPFCVDNVYNGAELPMLPFECVWNLNEGG